MPPGTGICHQVNLEYLSQTVWTQEGQGQGRRQADRRRGRLSRHAGRHRLPHHHGQRPRRARLGRRRHRGGSRHARPALFDAAAGSDRLQAHRQAQGRRDRDRPRAHRHADAAQARRGRQVRRVFRPRPRQSHDRRPRHHRQHGAGIRRDLRLLPDRRRHHQLSHATPAGRPRRSRWSPPMPRRRACTAPRRRPTRSSPTCSSSSCAQVEPSLAGPKRPQDRVALKDVKAGFTIAMEKEFNKGGDGGGKDVFDLHPSLATVARQELRQGRRRQARAGRRPQARSRPRRRGDRRDHLLHQHLQSERDDRRRAAGAQGGGEGPDRQAMGEDLARARLAGGRRISRQVRPAEGPRQARLQSRRLRLHHLHRQFRPAGAGDFQGHQRERSGRRRGAVRQPQLRRPRQRRRARELSRLAAAGRRLCARRLDVFRSRQAAARPRQEGQEGLPQGHLADEPRDQRRDAQDHHQADVREEIRRRVQGRRATGARSA